MSFLFLTSARPDTLTGDEFRLENVDHAMQLVGSSMSLPDRVQSLEYTPHATYAAKHLREWYKSDVTKLVTKIYREDFETFGFDLRPEM